MILNHQNFVVKFSQGEEVTSTSEVESYNKREQREKKTVSWYDQNDQNVVEDEKVVDENVEIQVRRVRQSIDLFF